VASDRQARARVLDDVDVFGGELDRLVHRKLRIEHHHRRHDLGDRGDRRNRVGILREQRLAGGRIEDEHTGGLQIGIAVLGEFGRGDLRGARLDVLVRGEHTEGQRSHQNGSKEAGHGSLGNSRAGHTIANNPQS